MNTMSLFTSHNRYARFVVSIFGVLLFSAGINLFITPLNLYNGGLLGLCQLIRTFLISMFPNIPSNVDISGFIYYLANIPLFIVAYKALGKSFFFRTLICVTINTLALSFIPIPANPIFGDDILASCIFGGIAGGAGIGLILLSGGSLGGTEIVGLYLIKKNNNASIGKINVFINFFIYLICLLVFTPKIALYSIIYMVISSIIIDRVHSQNINVEVTIISRKNTKALEQALLDELYRGVTTWKSEGSYTHEPTTVLFSVMSKYELTHLHEIVRKYEPDAFVVANEGAHVYGNYLKKL